MYFSRCFSSQKVCSQRSKLLSFSKSLLHLSIPLVQSYLPSSSLKFSSLLLSNLTYLNYPDLQLLTKVKHYIKERTPYELTPDLTIQLLRVLSMRMDHDEGLSPILEDLLNYINTNFTKFSHKQLENIQTQFYLFDKKSPLPFNPILADKKSLLEMNLNVSLKETTELLLQDLKMKFPKELIVTISNTQSKIIINFLETNQKLTLYGIRHFEKKEILEMRRTLHRQKKPNLYFFERPPITNQKYKFLLSKKKDSSQKLNKLLFSDGELIKKEGKLSISGLLGRLGELSYLDKEGLSFFVENFLLNNPDEFHLKESENLLYTSDWGLSKPDELSSLLYILSLNQQPSSIVFCDMSILSEIQRYTENKSEKELKTLYGFLRLTWINELIDWTRKVNKSGCPICSKVNSFGPNDIYNALGPSDYDMGIREGLMAHKILKGLAMGREYREAIGFFGSDHLLEIAKNIGRILENEQGFFKKYKEKFIGMEEINKEIIDRKFDYKKMLEKEEVMEENLSRWALLCSAFTRERLMLPEEISYKQNLFEDYVKEYRNILNPENLVKDWKPKESEKKCYATEILLNF